MSRSLGLISLCVLVAASVIALAACGGGHPGPSVASVSGNRQSKRSAHADTLAVWRAAVTCAREHGMPNLPDPVMGADGRVRLPGFSQIPDPTPQVQSACAAQIRAVRATEGAQATVTPSDLAALVRLAACFRVHGYPDWPDPNAKGEFHLRSADAGTQAKLNRAQSACRSLFPPNGWSLTITPSGQ
jgi:hypothetical protein